MGATIEPVYLAVETAIASEQTQTRTTLMTPEGVCRTNSIQVHELVSQWAGKYDFSRHTLVSRLRRLKPGSRMVTASTEWDVCWKSSLGLYSDSDDAPRAIIRCHNNQPALKYLCRFLVNGCDSLCSKSSTWSYSWKVVLSSSHNNLMYFK